MKAMEMEATNQIAAHHYTECGLDYVLLENGFERHETPYGNGVSIRRADELHDAIAKAIVTAPYRLRGQEVRYLRAEMDLSQNDLGNLLGVTRGAVTRWEKNRDKPIEAPPDRLLRLIFALQKSAHEVVTGIVELLREIDDIEHSEETFSLGDFGWRREVA